MFIVILNSWLTILHCSVVRNNESSEELNTNLERLRLLSWQWKMHFNAETEVTFSTKRNIPLHDPLKLGNVEIDRKTKHTHNGMVLDSKLSFQSHIRETIYRTRRGIGIIRHLSKYSLEMFLIRLINFIYEPMMIMEMLLTIDTTQT